MDHPSNPNHPTRWHVQSDGWMGPAFSPDSPYGLARDHPLALRYRLLVHSGNADAERFNRAWETSGNPPTRLFRHISASSQACGVEKSRRDKFDAGKCGCGWCRPRSSKPVRGLETDPWWVRFPYIPANLLRRTNGPASHRLSRNSRTLADASRYD